MFNASSSEIYKGHVNYTIKENDTNKYHNHPYSIAKTLGTEIVNYYRKTYNLHVSNGIIFTTESKLKSEEFLLKKVSTHLKKWKNNKIDVFLELGNLDSYRNIIHASDVASSIKVIKMILLMI